jgi:hypothetical protein
VDDDWSSNNADVRASDGKTYKVAEYLAEIAHHQGISWCQRKGLLTVG